MDLRGLGDLLIDSGIVPRPHVEALFAKVSDDVIAGELHTLAIENEEALAEVLAHRCQHPAIVFASSCIDLDAVGLMPPKTIRELQLLPVLRRGDAVTIASPAGASVPLERLGAALGLRVEVVVAVPLILELAIDRALSLRDQGATVLRGARATGDDAAIRLASPPRKMDLPRPDSVARMLSEVLVDAVPRSLQSTAPSRSTALVALKLKRIPAPDTSGAVEKQELVERARRPIIMVVEDDDAIRKLLARTLERDAYDVVEVASGDAVGPALQKQRPDLLLLDAMLPQVHGFEICAALKSSPAWRSLPVVMLSAVYRGFEQAREIQEVYLADHFIEKPFQVEHVRTLCADILKRPSPVLPHDALSTDRYRALVDHSMTVGDVAGARAQVLRWLQRDPLSARAWLEFGHIALDADETAEALRAYELASVYDRQLFSAQLSLAVLYERLGFSRRARETWCRAADVAPDAATGQRIRDALGATSPAPASG